MPRGVPSGWILYLAQGFGLGRVPLAPGTVGSVAGLLWLLFLLSTGHLWSFAAGILTGIALSIWACGVAEEILRLKDPPSVVLDEIVALPVAFMPWVLSFWFRYSSLPPVEEFFQNRHWTFTLMLFALFRVFDVAKPWPVRQSQRLPGGWGITVDDLLASFYAALCSLLLLV
jgi:phosphatidylglycerophosphatase A